MYKVTVTIQGRVQGVAYRYSTQEKASELGVKGWVKNLPTGDVQACFYGSKDQLKAILDWCEEGPSFARVTRVDQGEWYEVEAEDEAFSRGFEIRY